MGINNVIDLLVAACGTILTGIAAFFIVEFREMRRSIESLNVAIAKILDRVETHEDRISKLEERHASN